MNKIKSMKQIYINKISHMKCKSCFDFQNQEVHTAGHVSVIFTKEEFYRKTK